MKPTTYFINSLKEILSQIFIVDIEESDVCFLFSLYKEDNKDVHIVILFFKRSDVDNFYIVSNFIELEEVAKKHLLDLIKLFKSLC